MSAFNNTVSSIDSLDPSQFTNDVERFQAKEALRKALVRMETPFERIWALSFENPPLIAGLRICVDLGIWKKWAAIYKEKGGAELTLEQIVALCEKKPEANLLRRFLRHISALYMLEETGPDTWKPTTFSLALGDEAGHISAGVVCGDDHTLPCALNMPKFLAKYDYKDPVDLAKLDNYTDMTGGTSFFAACAADPEGRGGSFIGLMTALRNHKMDWTEVYDTKRIVDGADVSGNTPLFVDIGGAHGLDTERLLNRHPELPQDVLILQDTPEVVGMEMEGLDSRIKRMPYDFFTPQPVVGARAYFFHAVPHDWPDADCVRMFEQVKKVFKKGYSKLLIYEVVLPKVGASNMQTALDLELMNCTSGLERTEGHWTRLLKQAGFKIVDMSRHPRAVEGVIEADLE